MRAGDSAPRRRLILSHAQPGLTLDRDAHILRMKSNAAVEYENSGQVSSHFSTFASLAHHVLSLLVVPLFTFVISFLSGPGEAGNSN